MKSDTIYLGHIADAIEKIESHLKNVEYFEMFKNSDLYADAVIREIEIIGEAANNVSKKFQKDNPEIPWRKMIGIRNHLIHEYFGVDKKLVWETYQKDLPELKKIIKDYLD